MSEHETSNEIINYFDDFVASLATYLRPHQQSLGSDFCGAAQRELSMLVYQADDIVCARLIARKLRERVRVWRPQDPNDITTCHFSGVLRRGHQVQASCVAKRTPATLKMGIHRVGKSGENVVLSLCSDGRAGQLLIVPQVIGVDPTISSHPIELTESPSLPVGAYRLAPEWLAQWTSPHSTSDPLEGLDPDPKLAAYGVAEGILRIANIRTDSPRKRFDDARSELATAIKSLSKANEKAIHPVIERYPWILVHEHEYSQFRSEPRLNYIENVESSEGVITEENKTIVPDFIYELRDDTILCVEIESYTKRIFTTRSETGFSVPSSQTTKAAFQINNYQQIIDSYGHNEICNQLDKPSVTLFKYLLVVGSGLQPDFDARSWAHYRRQMQQNLVEVQNWDACLDKLARLAEASDFAPPGPQGA